MRQEQGAAFAHTSERLPSLPCIKQTRGHTTLPGWEIQHGCISGRPAPALLPPAPPAEAPGCHDSTGRSQPHRAHAVLPLGSPAAPHSPPQPPQPPPRSAPAPQARGSLGSTGSSRPFGTEHCTARNGSKPRLQSSLNPSLHNPSRVSQGKDRSEFVLSLFHTQ